MEHTATSRVVVKNIIIHTLLSDLISSMLRVRLIVLVVTYIVYTSSNGWCTTKSQHFSRRFVYLRNSASFFGLTFFWFINDCRPSLLLLEVLTMVRGSWENSHRTALIQLAGSTWSNTIFTNNHRCWDESYTRGMLPAIACRHNGRLVYLQSVGLDEWNLDHSICETKQDANDYVSSLYYLKPFVNMCGRCHNS